MMICKKKSYSILILAILFHMQPQKTYGLSQETVNRISTLTGIATTIATYWLTKKINNDASFKQKACIGLGAGIVVGITAYGYLLTKTDEYNKLEEWRKNFFFFKSLQHDYDHIQAVEEGAMQRLPKNNESIEMHARQQHISTWPLVNAHLEAQGAMTSLLNNQNFIENALSKIEELFLQQTSLDTNDAISFTAYIEELRELFIIEKEKITTLVRQLESYMQTLSYHQNYNHELSLYTDYQKKLQTKIQEHESIVNNIKQRTKENARRRQQEQMSADDYQSMINKESNRVKIQLEQEQNQLKTQICTLTQQIATQRDFITTLQETIRQRQQPRPAPTPTPQPDHDLQPTEPVTDDCSICLGAITPQELTTKTLCNHLFHRECLNTWRIRQNTCPLCRANLN